MGIVSCKCGKPLGFNVSETLCDKCEYENLSTTSDKKNFILNYCQEGYHLVEFVNKDGLRQCVLRKRLPLTYDKDIPINPDIIKDFMENGYVAYEKDVCERNINLTRKARIESEKSDN